MTTPSADKDPVGIRSYGVYIPRLRMARAAIADAHKWALPALKGLAKGEKSLCNWDEDAITMAVEAGRDCLRDTPADGIGHLCLASTTAPYAELQNAAVVSAALRLPQSTGVSDAGGSTRSGLTAITTACSTPDSGTLLVAADKRSGKPGSAQEMLYGSAAAALLLGRGPDLVARYLGTESVTVPFVDRFRKAGERFDYVWEERWIRDEGVARIVPAAVSRLLERIGRTPADIACFGLAGAPAGSDKRVAKALSIAPDRVLPDLRMEIGDTGTAHAPLQIAAALERAAPGDCIVVASFAQGCEVVAFEMLAQPQAGQRRGLAGALARRAEESAYLKMLSFEDHIALDWGMRAEADNKTALTQLYRAADQIFGFVGGRCDACGAVQFPRLPACVNCGAVDAQTPHPLADEPAKVATYTADWLQYSPAPPLYMGLVQFDAGARLLMEMVDVDPAALDVGTPLEMRFRIKDRDRLRQYDRYFWKAAPTG